MEMRLPRSVVEIIDRLESLGYEAYAVGGCVRDTLLGREPEDWDITTSAKPEAVKKAFDRTIDTGIEHGTVTVMKNHVGYEVTTYRIDGEYEDNRHPKQVSFTGNLVDDLERRDFTINAMAYNPKTGLVDAFDGTSDLKRRIILLWWEIPISVLMRSTAYAACCTVFGTASVYNRGKNKTGDRRAGRAFAKYQRGAYTCGNDEVIDLKRLRTASGSS